MFFLSSTFSIQMLSTFATVDCTPISLRIARDVVARAVEVENVVNPRHASTAALSKLMGGGEAKGGFASLKSGDEMLVILPPGEFMNRDGKEIVHYDLKKCQFWHVQVK